MKQAVLYDFHGTLVNVMTIRGLLADREYESFYVSSLSCPPIESTVLASRQSHEAGYANLLFTGMPADHAEGLSEWLDRHHVPIDLINMRPSKDRRKDFVVKREMYLAAVAQGYQILKAWDDNPRCLDLWTRQGIPVVRVPGWDENLVIGRVDNSQTAS